MQKILFLICVITLFFSAGCAVHAQKGPDEQNRKSVLIVINVSGTTAQWERELAHTLRMLLEKKGFSARIVTRSDTFDPGLYGNPIFIVEVTSQQRVFGSTVVVCRITRVDSGSLVWRTELYLDKENAMLINPIIGDVSARLLMRRMRLNGVLRRMKRG
jgi:hypothetical protein